VVEESLVQEHMVPALQAAFLTAEEPVTAAIELIHTACTTEAQCTSCITTLSKFIGNVQKDPSDPKYRKIRLTNAMVQERVAAVAGAVDLLRAVGFEDEVIDGEPHLVLGHDSAALLAVGADQVVEALVSGTAAAAEFVHNPQLVPAHRAASAVSLPTSFYTHSKTDVQLHATMRVAERNDELSLRTQAMRDKNIAAKKGYKFALIRVRFPDRQVLQATFRVTDTVGKLAQVVAECLDAPAEFTLHRPGAGPTALDDHSRTMLDADLAPSSLLNIAFRDPSNAPSLRGDLTFVAD
jgi:UBX domain-containing protein 6